MTAQAQVASDGDVHDENKAELVPSSGLMDVPVAPIQARDIDEDETTEDRPLARIERASIQLRRWIVAGVGALVGLVLFTSPVIVLVRPEAANFAASYLQTGLAGLFGIGGTVVAYLFTRDTS